MGSLQERSLIGTLPRRISLELRPRFGRFWVLIATVLTFASLSNGSTEPPNHGAIVTLAPDGSSFQITYDGHALMRGRVHSAAPVKVSLIRGTPAHTVKITQRIGLTSGGALLRLEATVAASDQAFPKNPNTGSSNTLR